MALEAAAIHHALGEVQGQDHEQWQDRADASMNASVNPSVCTWQSWLEPSLKWLERQ